MDFGVKPSHDLDFRALADELGDTRLFLRRRRGAGLHGVLPVFFDRRLHRRAARARGARSLQGWLIEDFGAIGARTYNVVVGLRLLSEVFANLLVVGMIFSVAFPATESASIWSILVVGALALLYSAWGGLGASLRTDVAQMAVFWRSSPRLF